MKLKLFLFIFFLFFFKANFAFAIADPKSTPNNKMGVHILFASELNSAADIVNANGGDWGYVTIPIQAGDKDIEKWQKFMASARQRHIIPIIRLATEGDYFNTSVWRKPMEEDVLDFANFLDSLDWPIKNKYIVVFNEVNRGDEWGGVPNPKEYARILDYAVTIFKEKSEDFFIISSGLDNAAENSQNSMNEYDFMSQMAHGAPDIFKKIDGLGSHSYPNPAFAQAPWLITDKNVTSFRFEQNLAGKLSGKILPMFITETGWSRHKLTEDQISSHFVYAFENIWNDENVIAVTPFLLHAGSGPFEQFSLLSADGSLTKVSKALKNLAKTKGRPSVNSERLVLARSRIQLPLKTFPQKIQYENYPAENVQTIAAFFKWIIRISS